MKKGIILAAVLAAALLLMTGMLSVRPQAGQNTETSALTQDRTGNQRGYTNGKRTEETRIEEAHAKKKNAVGTIPVKEGKATRNTYIIGVLILLTAGLAMCMVTERAEKKKVSKVQLR